MTGTYCDPGAGKVTFAAWFADWADRQVWVRGTQITAGQAAGSVTFGAVSMASIRPSHIQQWIKTLDQNGVAPTTIRTRYNYVRAAFRAAVTDRVIPADPAAGTTLPRARKPSAAMTIPNPEEVGRALDAASIYFRPFVSLCAFAGLRLGEAAGLQSGDVDFLRRTIRIRRQVQGENAATTRSVPPKYGSERVIHAASELIDMLATHIRLTGAGRGDFLFVTGDGGPQQEHGRRTVAADTPGGRDRRPLHAARPQALLRQRADRLRLRRGHRATGSGALVGDHHARRLFASLADRRGPHARRSRRPHGRRAAHSCGLSAD